VRLCSRDHLAHQELAKNSVNSSKKSVRKAFMVTQITNLSLTTAINEIRANDTPFLDLFIELFPILPNMLRNMFPGFFRGQDMTHEFYTSIVMPEDGALKRIEINLVTLKRP
jgi:hypothetical protein